MHTRLFIIAHAPLASALRECAVHVFPDCAADLLVLDVPPHEPPEQTLAAARALLEPLGAASVLVLTDVVGATPCNVAQRLVDDVHSHLLAGVNLPMLIKILGSRTKALEGLAVEAKQAGCQGIVVAGEVLRKKVAEG